MADATARSKAQCPPPASAWANVPQRHQCVKNGFCLSLTHSPCLPAEFMNLNLQHSFLLIPPCLCVCLISVATGLSGERQPLQWDCFSLSLSTSVATIFSLTVYYQSLLLFACPLLLSLPKNVCSLPGCCTISNHVSSGNV